MSSEVIVIFLQSRQIDGVDHSYGLQIIKEPVDIKMSLFKVC